MQLQITQALDQQRTLVHKMENLVPSAQLDEVRDQIDDIEQRLNEKLAALPFTFVPQVAKKAKRARVSAECPNCHEHKELSLKQKEGVMRVYRCRGCGLYVEARFIAEDQPCHSALVPVTKEVVACSVCHHTNEQEIPEFPGVSIEMVCDHCGSALGVSRTKDAINCRSLNGQTVPKKLLDIIAEKIPPQPWQTGMHKQVADELGLSNNIVDKAIGMLISSGRIISSAGSTYKQPITVPNGTVAQSDSTAH